MQQPQSNHTQPMQYSNPQYHPVQPSMMMCPVGVQYVYDPQMMISPDEQARPTPNRTFQNQAFLLNVQNTPPWVQQQPNMVYMPQMQMANNIQPYMPQQMVQNPMYQYQYQPMLMQERMRLPNYVNQNLIQNPQMVQHVMQNPQMMENVMQNPQMMQNSQMVQNPQMVQNVMQNSQVVQNGMQNPQMVQNGMQNLQMVNGMQNVQMIQNGMQNPQTLVQNPQNLVNSQNLMRSPVIFQQVEQKRESPRSTPMLQNQVGQPTNQNEIVSSPIVLKSHYQNAQPQMIIMSAVQKPHTCTNNQKKEATPVTIEKPKDEVPQHIRSQIPEGLSVKTITKVAATALVKPAALPNIAPVDESHPRVYPKPVVKPVSNRDPQTNYKRKIQEMSEQNNKDASEVETFKRNCLITKQEVVNKNNRVKIFFEIPDEAMLQNNQNTGQVSRQNMQNSVNRPQAEDKLLRNTVYVQARGRVNEKIINEMQNMSAEGNQIIMGTNNGLPIWQNNNMVQVNVPAQTERVLSDQVLPYNPLMQQRALVIYTENTSQTDEVKKKKPTFILKYDVGTATENFQNNIRIAPSNYGSKEIIKHNTQSETIKLSNNAEHDDTTMQNNSTMSQNLLSNEADGVKNSKNKEITISRADDGTPRKKLKITKRSHDDAESNNEINASKRLKTTHTVKNKAKPETKEIDNAKVKNINKSIIEAYVPTLVLDEHIIQESNVEKNKEKSQTKKLDSAQVKNIKTPIETHVPDGNIIHESNVEKKKEKSQTKKMDSAVKNIKTPIEILVPDGNIIQELNVEKKKEKSQTKKLDSAQVKNIKTPIETHVPDGNIIQESNVEKKKEKSQTKKLDSAQVKNIKTPIETHVPDGNIIQESNVEKKKEKSLTKKMDSAQVKNIKTPIETHVPDGNIIQESNVEKKKEKSQTKKMDSVKVKNINTPTETYVPDGHIIQESNIEKKKEKPQTKKMDSAKVKNKNTPVETYVLTHVLDGHIIRESNVEYMKEKSQTKKINCAKNTYKQIDMYVPTLILDGHIIQESNVEKKKEKYETKKKDSVKVKKPNTPTEPYVLTHVLDGHVIQESNVPFVIQRPMITPKIPPKETKAESEARPSSKDTIIIDAEDSNSSSIDVVDITPDSTGTEAADNIKETLETNEIATDRNVEPRMDVAGSETIDNTNEDDPFKHLSGATVQSWSVSELISHLMKHEDWQETAQVLEEQEVDGESLFLANEEQLICIGICEEHVKIISKFLERNRGKTTT